MPDVFIEHGDPAKLLALQGLDAAGIRASITARFLPGNAAERRRVAAARRADRGRREGFLHCCRADACRTLKVCVEAGISRKTRKVLGGHVPTMVPAETCPWWRAQRVRTKFCNQYIGENPHGSSFNHQSTLASLVCWLQIAAPAVHAQAAIRWRLASSFPKSLDTIYGGA